MTLIVDGYNLYFTGLCPGEEPRHIREAREHVASVISRYVAGKTAKAIIFFDGGPGGSHLPRVQWMNGIEVRYSTPRDDADTDIKEAIDNWHNGDDLCVVTSDNNIAAFARRMGAKVMKSQDFAREAAPVLEAKKDLRAGEPDAKYTGGTSRHEIDFWLNEFTKENRGRR